MNTQLWIPAYVGVGSNLGDPVAQVNRGVDALRSLPDTLLVARSKLYRTSPLGPQDQPEFINAAVGLLTQLDAPVLLERLKELEKTLGREQPITRWGPRLIDFDLLVFGDQRMAEPALALPHPGVHERAFVLIPLLDIAPDLEVPGRGRVRELAAKISHDGVSPIDATTA